MFLVVYLFCCFGLFGLVCLVMVFLPLLHLHCPEFPVSSTDLPNVGSTLLIVHVLQKQWRKNHPSTDSGCTHLLFSLHSIDSIELLRWSSAARELTCLSLLGIQIQYCRPSLAIKTLQSRIGASRKLTDGGPLRKNGWFCSVTFFLKINMLLFVYWLVHPM